MSVTVRPRGKAWQYDIYLTFSDGQKFHERKRAPGSSEEEAMRFAFRRESEIIKRDAPPVEPEAKKRIPKFEEFWPRFVRDHYRANQMKPSTISAAENIWKTHLQPLLGSKRLDRITTAEIASLKGTLAIKPSYANAKTRPAKGGAKSLAPKTITNILIVLSAALTAAKEWGLIKERPAIRMLPKADAAMEWYEVREYRRLVEGAAKVDTGALVAVLLGGSAGLRRGEMLALKWSDLDIPRRQIRVSRSIWWNKKEPHETLPKGGRSRFVRMTEELAAALKNHKHLKGERVLCDGDGRPLTDDAIYTLMQAAQRRAMLPETGALHVLRHTFCSHLAAAGAPANAIQKLAGHADLKTTQRYLHLSPNDEAAAMAALARYYSADEAETRAVAQG